MICTCTDMYDVYHMYVRGKKNIANFLLLLLTVKFVHRRFGAGRKLSCASLLPIETKVKPYPANPLIPITLLLALSFYVTPPTIKNLSARPLGASSKKLERIRTRIATNFISLSSLKSPKRPAICDRPAPFLQYVIFHTIFSYLYLFYCRQPFL